MEYINLRMSTFNYDIMSMQMLVLQHNSLTEERDKLKKSKAGKY